MRNGLTEEVKSKIFVSKVVPLLYVAATSLYGTAQVMVTHQNRSDCLLQDAPWTWSSTVTSYMCPSIVAIFSSSQTHDNMLP